MADQNWADLGVVLEEGEEKKPSLKQQDEPIPQAFADISVTPQLTEEPSSSEDTSTLRSAQALATGLFRGQTLGGAEEIAGLGGAAQEFALGGETSPEESQLERFRRLYEEYKGAAEKRGEKLREESPGLMMGGEIAGGFAMPGAGAIAKNIQGAGELAKARKMLQTFDVGKSAPEMLRLGERARRMAELRRLALTGAGVGATTGLTEGESNLVSPTINAIETGDPGQMVEPLQEVGSEMLSGAEMGAALGAASKPITAAAVGTVKGIGKVGKNITEIPYIQKLIKSFSDELKGKKLFGTQPKEQIANEVADFAEEMYKTLRGTTSSLGEARSKIIAAAEERGIRLPEDQVDDVLAKAMDAGDLVSRRPAAAREQATLEDLVRSYKEGKLVRRVRSEEVPTGQARVEKTAQVKRLEQEAIESGVAPEDIDVSYLPDPEAPDELVATIRQAVRDPKTGEITGYRSRGSTRIDKDEVPQLKQITEKVREEALDITRPTVAESLKRDIQPYTSAGESAFKETEPMLRATKLAQGLSQLQQSKIPGLAQATTKFGGAKEATKALDLEGINDPAEARLKLMKLLQQLGKDAGSADIAKERMKMFLSNVEKFDPDLAKELSPKVQEIASRYDIAREMVQPGLGGAVPYASVRGAPLLGAAATGRFIGSIGRMMPQEIQDIASFVAKKATPGAIQLSRALAGMLDKDERSKSAIMYGLMQNPAYREMLREAKPDLFTEEQAK